MFHTILHCVYFVLLFPQVFMSCNLIGGMFQRLDKMRKAAFASACLFGEDNNSSISGIWVWRGQDLAFTVGLLRVLNLAWMKFSERRISSTIHMFLYVSAEPRLANRLRIVQLGEARSN